ncbi:MAG: hypothetical protein FK734_07695, partial [Asgard group archaeon]|nr:hypothetical protein [Asgard group archaeon]
AKLILKNWQNNTQEAIFESLSNYSKWYPFPDEFDNSIRNENLTNIATSIGESLKKLITKISVVNDCEKAFLLSGGLDSRILAASIPDKFKGKTATYTYDSIKDGHEIKKASSIAKSLNLKHYTQIIDSEYIVENCYRHMWLNEGYSNHVVSILLKLIETNSDRRIFFDGYAGDTQFGGEFLNDLGHMIKKKLTPSIQLEEIMDSHEYSFHKKILPKLVRYRNYSLEKLLSSSYKDQSSMMWNIKDKNQILECLLLQTRIRGYTIGGPRTMINYSPVVLPYYHPEIVDKYIIIPQKFRRKRKFELTTLSVINNELCKESSTSLKWYNKLASTIFVKFGLLILRKLETLFRRKIIPAYSAVPYYDWMREQNNYHKMLNEIINDQNSIIWNFLDIEKTKRFYNDFIRRKNHYHKFILHIFDLEMILRLFYSLKDDTLPVFYFSESLKLKEKINLKLNLDYLKALTLTNDLC